MALIDKPSPAAPGALKMRVEGMDCGACALKIENALKRMPGVTEISVNYAADLLTLSLDEHRTSRTAVEDNIRALGYTPRPLLGGSPPAAAMPGKEAANAVSQARWWQTRKGRIAAITGCLLVLAFAIAEIAPALTFWAYLVVALVGLAPVARRAVAGAASGTPFGIETLMSIAVIGAIAIGAAEEAAVVIFLFAVGELLENVAAGRARAGIATLMNLVPRVAQVEEGGRTREVPIEQLRIGDIVLIRPGDRCPPMAR